MNRPRVRRLVLATTVWKRPGLTAIVLGHYQRMRRQLADHVDLELCAVGSEGRVSRNLCESHGFDYLEATNEPVSFKWNALVREVRRLEPDGIVLVNSDDLVSSNLPEVYLDRFSRGEDYCGLRGTDIFDTATERLGLWPGYEASYMQYRVGEPAGCARGFSRRLLDATGWRLWPPVPAKNSSMDFWSTRFLHLFGFAPQARAMEELGVYAVQIKTALNITSFERLPLRSLRSGHEAWHGLQRLGDHATVDGLRRLPRGTAGPPQARRQVERAPIFRVEEIQPPSLRDQVLLELDAMRRAVATEQGGPGDGKSPGAGMSATPQVSVLINSHNYAEYLPEAIESALQQSYPATEVVVVDDGSTDDSRQVIEGFGERVRAVLKPNGGQASAFNAGVAASRGEILCFLDADDLCDAHRAERLVELFARLPAGRPALFYHRLRQFGARDDGVPVVPASFRDLDRRPIGGEFFRVSSPEAAFRYAERNAFIPFLAPPTSGTALNRELAELVFPIPETHQVGADCVVVRAGTLATDVFGTDEVLGSRRLHETNHSRAQQKHMVDPTFLRSLDHYLNGILRQSGSEPIISFFDSNFAARYYWFIGARGQLLRLGLKAMVRDPGMRSLRFSLRMLRYVFSGKRPRVR